MGRRRRKSGRNMEMAATAELEKEPLRIVRRKGGRYRCWFEEDEDGEMVFAATERIGKVKSDFFCVRLKTVDDVLLLFTMYFRFVIRKLIIIN